MWGRTRRRIEQLERDLFHLQQRLAVAEQRNTDLCEVQPLVSWVVEALLHCGAKSLPSFVRKETGIKLSDEDHRTIDAAIDAYWGAPDSPINDGEEKPKRKPKRKK